MDFENRTHRVATQVGFGVFLLGVYTLSAAFLIEQLPLPHLIVEAFLVQMNEQELVSAFENAMYAIFAGFLTAVAVGIPIGLGMGVNRRIEQLFDPYINALYVLPFAALVPAFIVWFGTGFRVRLVIVFLFALFPIAINTFEGAKTTPANLLEVARSYNASRRFMIANVVVPHEMPYILAGLRLGIGRAVKGLVVTEIIVAVTGIGGLIQRWSAAYRLEGVISIVILLMLVGILLPWILQQVHDRIIWWDISETG